MSLTPFPFVFVGDGIVEEDPQEWLRQVKLFALSRSESDKIKVFELCLAPGSPVEGWYDSLHPDKASSFKSLCQAFSKQFPGTPYTPLPAWLPLERLETCVLREQDIGRDIEEEGTGLMLPAHVAYARRIQKLAAAVPEPEGQLVANARHRLPPSVRACIPKHLKSWDAYVDAVLSVSTYDILKAQERAGGGVAGSNGASLYGAASGAYGAPPTLSRHESARRTNGSYSHSSSSAAAQAQAAASGYNASDLPAPHVVEFLAPSEGGPAAAVPTSEHSPTSYDFNNKTSPSQRRGYYPSASNGIPYDRDTPSAPPMVQTRSWLQTERSPQSNGSAPRAWGGR